MLMSVNPPNPRRHRTKFSQYKALGGVGDGARAATRRPPPPP
eukprot:SAG31_NODE_6062_length_2187_cov_1.309387_1_plen_41_part_10